MQYFHHRRGRVVDGEVRQPGPVHRPPVGDICQEHFLCFERPCKLLVSFAKRAPGICCCCQRGFPGFYTLFSVWNSPCEAGIRPTLISPVREPVHHMLLLISRCQAQRFAGHAWLVVDISVKHIGLAWAAETDSANPLSKTVRIGCQTPSKSEWIIGQHKYTSESQYILIHRLICCRWSETQQQKPITLKGEQVNYECKTTPL